MSDATVRENFRIDDDALLADGTVRHVRAA
jgi:hypothetical protein